MTEALDERDYPKAIWVERGEETNEKRWFSIRGMGVEYVRADFIASDWRPIESAPKGRRILGYGKLVGTAICIWREGQWNKTDRESPFQFGSTAVTHWMPLPEPPEGSARKLADAAPKPIPQGETR